MRELLCFTIGMALGALIMKRNQAIDDLREELAYERRRNRSGRQADN